MTPLAWFLIGALTGAIVATAMIITLASLAVGGRSEATSGTSGGGIHD